MACFVVPAAEAVITTVAAKVIKTKEKEKTVKLSLSDGSVQEATKIKFSTKLGWLNKLLWGGSALLAFEHVWHGEAVPFFPFLTAVNDNGIFSCCSMVSSCFQHGCCCYTVCSDRCNFYLRHITLNCSDYLFSDSAALGIYYQCFHVKSSNYRTHIISKYYEEFCLKLG